MFEKYLTKAMSALELIGCMSNLLLPKSMRAHGHNSSNYWKYSKITSLEITPVNDLRMDFKMRCVKMFL